MHELSIAQNIIDIVVNEMTKNRLARVETVSLRVGEMTQILPDALHFGFDCLARESPVAGAKLIIEQVPAQGYCRTCDVKFAISGWLLNCPDCQTVDVDIISGKELEIVEIEGEEGF